jgi:hypothetical protein
MEIAKKIEETNFDKRASEPKIPDEYKRAIKEEKPSAFERASHYKKPIVKERVQTTKTAN